ncbi:protease complex subunit PrcB family protein [Paucibacter soli]|uniref:protease complex subunit PrcB family protein n=1 Tax=Paucibacter soli TaxID=3133433 RepID=UPI0030B6265B
MPWLTTLGLAVAAALSACGGGGTDSLGPEPKPLILQGTAAVGMAVVGGQVSGKCLKGTGSATTAADGGYKIIVPDGQLPCALELKHAASGLQLRSLAVPGGNGETANLTLLTEMVTTRLARRDAAAYFAGFDAAAGKALSVDKVKLAQADVGKLLAPTTEIRNLGDFLGTPLKAATPANPGQGDAQDKLLDALHMRLSKARQAQLLGVLANAADPVDPAPFQPWITVEPQALSMLAGASQSLMADINYPPNVVYVRQPVKWALLEANGGAVEALNGKYTAPSANGVYHVRATREDFGSVSADVTVTVGQLQSLDQRAISGIKKARNAVVLDQAAWAELWGQHVAGNTPAPVLPAVDFGKEMVLAVFLGERSNGCASVAISGVASNGAALQVVYQEGKPAAGSNCAQVLSAPAHLVRLPRSALPVEFVPKP